MIEMLPHSLPQQLRNRVYWHGSFACFSRLWITARSAVVRWPITTARQPKAPASSATIA